jgi:hypothetical protein
MSLTQVAIAAVEQRKRQERHAVTHAPAREAVPPSHAEVHRVPRPKLGVRALTRAFFERTHTKDLDEISEDDDDTPRPFCIIWPDSNFRDCAETSTTQPLPPLFFACVARLAGGLPRADSRVHVPAGRSRMGSGHPPPDRVQRLLCASRHLLLCAPRRTPPHMNMVHRTSHTPPSRDAVRPAHARTATWRLRPRRARAQLELEPTHPWFWVELLFDVIFLIDCFGINFNTAVVTEAGLSTDRCVIAKKYLSFCARSAARLATAPPRA